MLEVNPRASRTVPFLSKVTGVPMVDLATQHHARPDARGAGLRRSAGRPLAAQPLVAVKAPVFSMSKLVGVETSLGPEMKTTGEVMGIDRTYPAALRKALIAAGIEMPVATARPSSPSPTATRPRRCRFCGSWARAAIASMRRPARRG